MNKGYYEIIFYAICFLTILCGVFFVFQDKYSLAIKIFLTVICILSVTLILKLIYKNK